jgi:hypothetical protein
MAEKLAKADVDYGPGDTDGQHCGVCEHFTEPHYCALVAGKIRSGGWCRKWLPKGGEPKAETKEVKDGEVSKE